MGRGVARARVEAGPERSATRGGTTTAAGPRVPHGQRWDGWLRRPRRQRGLALRSRSTHAWVRTDAAPALLRLHRQRRNQPGERSDHPRVCQDAQRRRAGAAVGALHSILLARALRPARRGGAARRDGRRGIRGAGQGSGGARQAKARERRRHARRARGSRLPSALRDGAVSLISARRQQRPGEQRRKSCATRRRRRRAAALRGGGARAAALLVWRRRRELRAVQQARLPGREGAGLVQEGLPHRLLPVRHVQHEAPSALVRADRRGRAAVQGAPQAAP